MSEKNKMIACRAFEEVMSRGGLALAEELYTGDYIGHSSSGEVNRPEGAKQFVSMMRGAFPDLKVAVLRTRLPKGTGWQPAG